MQIHRVKKGETVYSIAREYGVSPTKITEINRLKNPDRLAVGRELLILIPTRTYTARRGDTLDLISRRFSVSKSELIKNNPSLSGAEKIYPEEVFAVKYPERSHGIALLNGYLYKDTPRERLNFVLPYLSHITLSAAIYENGRLRFIFDGKEAVKEAKGLGKSPILRVYCRASLSDADFGEEFIEKILSAAKSAGCSGIMLSGQKKVSEEGFSDFLFELKKAAISEGATLFIETDGKICEKCADTADSLILTSDEYCGKKNGEVDKNFEALYKDFTDSADALKSFIDLSPFAYRGGEPLPIDTVLSYADTEGAEIKESEDGMTATFILKGEEVIFPTLKNLKARLDLAAELGYLGYSIDIMRCPWSHLMMLSSLFHLSPSYFSGGI